MPTVSECCDPCNPTQVPGVQGDPGADGVDGINGVSAFTLVTAAAVVPAIGANVTLTVGNSTWAAIGQIVYLGDGIGYYEVVAIPSSSSIQLENLGYVGNAAAATAIPIGTALVPGGVQGPTPILPDTQVSAFGTGTEYQLTTTPAAVVMGTSSPDLVLTVAGTWQLFARLRVDYNAATFAAVRTVTATLFRANNTPGNVTSSSASFETEIITTLTYTAEVLSLPPVIYTTANVNDQIQLYASIDVLPSAGNIAVSQCEIIAVLISTP